MKHSTCCGTHYFKDHHGFVQRQWELHIGVFETVVVVDLQETHRSSAQRTPRTSQSFKYQMRIDHIRFLVVGLKLQHVTKVWGRLCISLPPFPCIYDQSPKDLVTPYSSVKLKQ